VGVGLVPTLLLGRTLDRFAIGGRATLALEFRRHLGSVHFNYDILRAWDGPLLHEVFVTVGFDPFGFLHF